LIYVCKIFSSVDIVMGNVLDGQGLIPARGKRKIFLFSKVSRLALVSNQSPIQWVLGAVSQEVKRPGREADHSPLSSAKVIGRAIPPFRQMSSWHSA
jgi:hypothetical protein